MRLYIFSCLLTLCGMPACATCIPDSAAAAAIPESVTPAAMRDSGTAAADTVTLDKYGMRIRRRYDIWMKLIPTQSVIQFAGNMGVVSVGVGWNYGRRKQWETNLLIGYLPKFKTGRDKITMTLKENFVPWGIPLNHGWEVEPLSCGLYLNTVFGSEFWGSQPHRYPDKYYPFLSTKVRINVFTGQRIEKTVPRNRRKFIKSVTAFYEVSTCDLYVRAMIQDGHVSLWDILGLSLGLKFQIF